MIFDVEFLFNTELIAGVEKLIRDSKKNLLLISPFIDLDARIMDALNEKKEKYDFELNVLFGKNENNCYKSIKKNSVDYLKQFPNIEIRYNERLHAKFYLNDSDFIMTSLNLYDYSLANNIEVGVKGRYAPKGFLRKALVVPDNLLYQGYEKIKHNFLGLERDADPLEKFETIFNNSELKFKTKPIFEDKTGTQSLLTKKKFKGFEVVVNKFDNVSASEKNIKQAKVTTTIKTTRTFITEARYISGRQIAKKFKIQPIEVKAFMEQKGYIKKDKITDAGKLKGLILKKYLGNEYIAYPENLREIKELAK